MHVADSHETFAHSLPSPANRRDWERLGGHLRSVALCAGRLAGPFGCSALAELAGLLHDIGKNSEAFQAYIRGLGPSLDHSTAGAVEAGRLFPDISPVLAYVIAGHHAGLADGADLRLRLGKALPPYAGWEAHTGPLPKPAPPRFSASPHQGFSLFFLTRMIFSALVDADFLETERFYAEAEGCQVERGGFQPIAVLAGRLRAFMARMQTDTELNRLRGAILAHAVGRAGCAPGLFTMTVPTGGGKTLASLSFALEHAVLHGLRRVIYVAPYTSIIEQTAQVFRTALGCDKDVLEHHGNFDWQAAEDRDGEADRDGVKKLQRAAENWEAPVVVTTAVQFFESLFAARTSRCRKLHNIAGSVVILDEAQTLPLGLLRPCMAALDELARNYGASIVLCTATQPALRRRDGALRPDKNKPMEGFDIGPERELAPDPQDLYTRLKRVAVEVLPGPVTDAAIAARFAEQPQMLCIVNSRGHAKALFELIRGEAGARHLTTLMCPAHRRQVLAEIREALKQQRPVRLVATSLIEAGVDVDFPEVWRTETGLDSIAQAAGRCNREGRLASGRVVVFSAADHQLPKAFRVFQQAAQEPLAMEDPLGLPAVERYFKQLYFNRGYQALDAAKIDGRPGILADIDRSRPYFNFASIAAAFRMIDETMRPVIVNWRGEAEAALAALRGAEIPPGWAVRKLQQYTVSIPESSWNCLLGGGIEPVHRRFGDRFMLLTSEGLYDDETGLRLDDFTARTVEQNIIS